MKASLPLAFIFLVLGAVEGYSYNLTQQKKSTSTASSSPRRRFLRDAAAMAGGLLIGSRSTNVRAVEDAPTPVYFGVGCFWHIQHEFIEGERKILGRSDNQLTSLAGYAGGKSIGKDGQVCYHNFQGIADYGKLGHGEVVGMNIPQSKISDFAELYFSLYDPKTKDRVDPMDRGAEYRSLMGLPGGVAHPKYPEVVEVASKSGFSLVSGKGNDPDTLGKQVVYIMDSNEFPFYQAEVYHQYHNDFQSPPYGKNYNKLADIAFEDGRIKSVMCPDRV